jgi:hypothetical protein
MTRAKKRALMPKEAASAPSAHELPAKAISSAAMTGPPIEVALTPEGGHGLSGELDLCGL